MPQGCLEARQLPWGLHHWVLHKFISNFLHLLQSSASSLFRCWVLDSQQLLSKLSLACL